LAHSEEEADEEDVNEELDAEPPQQPPPPPPTLIEVMDRQTQLLQRLTEAVESRNNRAHHQGPLEEDLQRKIERFIHLKAPTFSYAEDPMEADDWLRVIETKLDLTNCTDEE
jgi:predicted double-glycine peptidase